MIELLHSSQYISKIHQDLKFDNNINMIVNYNNDNLLGISNLPNNKNIYTVDLRKIKTRKSIKTNKKIKNKFISNFSNTVNINIIVKINYNILLKHLQRKSFPNKKEFFKLLKRNVKPNIKHDELVYNLIKNINYFAEYSWYINRENDISKIKYMPSSIYKMKDLYFNLDNETYFLTDKNLFIHFSIKGGIILGDMNVKYDYFNNLLRKTNEKTLIISDYQDIWRTYISKTNTIIVNKNNIENLKEFIFDRIIYDDCIDYKGKNINTLKKITGKKKWFISRKSYSINFNDLVYIFDLLFSYNLSIYDKNLIEKCQHFFIRHDKNYKINMNKIKIKLNDFEKNFYIKYCDKKDKNLYFSLPINKINMRFKKNKIDNIVKKCSICLSKIDKNNIGVTECNHFFCYSCIFKHLSVNNKCPLCRHTTSLNKTYKIIDKETKNVLPSKLNYILDIIDKNDIVILSKYEKSLENIENFFNDINIDFLFLKNKKAKHKKIVITTYENFYKNDFFDREIILLEPLSNSLTDNYYKSILKFKNYQNYQNKINVLISKNTFEEFL